MPLPAAADPAAATVTRRVPAAKVPLTQQQLDARKAMADSLSAVAGEALKATESTSRSKEESSRFGKSGMPGKIGQTSSFANPGADKKAGKGPAILTNEGEREAANSRLWLISFLLVVAVIAGVVFLATRVGQRSAAVIAFIAEVPPADNRFGKRMEAIQARAWTPSVTSFVTLPSPVIGSERAIASTALTEALSSIAGLTYVPAADRWITADKVDWLNKQVADDAKGLPQRLERAGVVSVDNKAFTQLLRNANLSDDELTIVNEVLMISGPLAGKLAKGPAPTIRWCTVHGKEGTWLFNPGGDSYKPRLSDYQGLLVAFTGEGWPTEWRFLKLNAVKK